MRTHRVILMTLAATLAAASALAQSTPDTSARPERGLRMPTVEARYGAPTARYPAVGTPPITRWEYPSMVVYFENNRVIHAVLLPASR
jgi:hypothetical protein